MRVAHVCERFSSLSETFIYDQITELERQGVDSWVVTPDRTNEKDRPYSKVKTVRRPAWWDPRWGVRRALAEVGVGKAHASGWPVVRPQIERALREMGPDVIHAHFGTAGVLLRPVAERLRIPLVVSFYGFDVSSYGGEEWWRKEYRKLWESADRIIALSSDMKSKIRALGCSAEKIDVVHLSRDLDDFSFKLPSRPVRSFLSVGRLTEKKGHDDAIKALKSLVDDGYDPQLKVIGDGPLEKELAALTQGCGVSKHVDWLGAKPNSKVIQCLQKSDAFLLCSKRAANGDEEGTPTVLVEAQAVGLPCVSTRHAGIPEMIPNENQFLLAEEGSVEQIASCMRRLMKCSVDELEEIATEGIKNIRENFNIKNESKKLTKIYNEA